MLRQLRAGSDQRPERYPQSVVLCGVRDVRKVLHRRHGLETTIEQGLEQTARYMDRCGSRAGHLVIFDPSPDKSWDQKVYRRDESLGGCSITVWGM